MASEALRWLGILCVIAAASWATAAQCREEPLLALPKPLGSEAVNTLKISGPIEVRRSPNLETGDVLLTVPVRHALTGTLSVDIYSKGRVVLPVGTPVFGMRISNTMLLPQTEWATRNGVPARSIPMNNQTVWCTVGPHRLRPESKEATACLPMYGAYFRWVEASPALFPAVMEMSSKTPWVDSFPQVTPGPIEGLPEMQLSYAFGGWKEAGLELVKTLEQSGIRLMTIRNVLPRDGGRSVTLRIQGGRFRFSQETESIDRAVVSIELPPSPDIAPSL